MKRPTLKSSIVGDVDPRDADLEQNIDYMDIPSSHAKL